MISLGVVWRRYHIPEGPAEPTLVAQLLAVTLLGVGAPLRAPAWPFFRAKHLSEGAVYLARPGWRTASSCGVCFKVAAVLARCRLLEHATVSLAVAHPAACLQCWLQKLACDAASSRALCTTCFAAGLSVSYTARGPWPLVLVFGVLWVAASLSLLLRPVMFRPAGFAVPLSPITPCLALLVDVHLIGALCVHAAVCICTVRCCCRPSLPA